MIELRPTENLDKRVVRGFGEEWSRFNQDEIPQGEYDQIFESYFRIFPWHLVTSDAVGFDLGCGSGRWAKGVAPKVGILHCIDPSSAALAVAKSKLRAYKNCVFHEASVHQLPMADESCDFGFSLGVLHHVPDTSAGIKACVQKLKPGAPFLLYLYYAFDNRPAWFRGLWAMSNLLRLVVARCPRLVRNGICDLIALMIYYPLARFALLGEFLGFKPDLLPLAAYRQRSFYVMRTDALDRFGTRLEQRFTRAQIQKMMEKAGLVEIHFSNSVPFWVSVGLKA